MFKQLHSSLAPRMFFLRLKINLEDRNKCGQTLCLKPSKMIQISELWHIPEILSTLWQAPQKHYSYASYKSIIFVHCSLSPYSCIYIVLSTAIQLSKLILIMLCGANVYFLFTDERIEVQRSDSHQFDAKGHAL